MPNSNMQAQKAKPRGKKPLLSILLKNTHMLRCRSLASLQRTASTPSVVDFSRASHLDLFEQPARAFFNTLYEYPKMHVLDAASLCRAWSRDSRHGSISAAFHER